MTATSIAYRKPRKDKRQKVTGLPDGIDMLTLLASAVDKMPPNALINKKTETYIRVKKDSVAKLGRTLSLTTIVGTYGETGSTVDVGTHETKHTHGTDEAPVIETHAVLVVPEKSDLALLFVERAGTRAGGAGLSAAFRDVLRLRYPEYVFDINTVVETRAWLETAKLRRVSATLYGWSEDLTDAGVGKVVGDFNRALEPQRGERYLPDALWKHLLDRSLRKGRALGFPEDEEPDEVVVEVEGPGRSGSDQEKMFVLGKEKFPSIRYLVSDFGQKPLDLPQFRAFALSKTEELLKDMGAEHGQFMSADPWHKYVALDDVQLS